MPIASIFRKYFDADARFDGNAFLLLLLAPLSKADDIKANFAKRYWRRVVPMISVIGTVRERYNAAYHIINIIDDDHNGGRGRYGTRTSVLR